MYSKNKKVQTEMENTIVPGQRKEIPPSGQPLADPEGVFFILFIPQSQQSPV